MMAVHRAVRASVQSITLGMLSLVGGAAVVAAETALYDTGPAEDAAFVRFVTAGPLPVSVTASGSQARLALTEAQPASHFLPVRGGSAIKGAMTLGGKSTPIDLTVTPGQFATVVGTPGPAGTLSLQVLRDTPDDFNALKAAVAFHNAASGCLKAGLQAVSLHAAGKAVDVFRDVAPGTVTRRLINPVALSVQLVCDGKAVGAPLSLGTLAAGQRYSVFAVAAAGASVASGAAAGASVAGGTVAGVPAAGATAGGSAAAGVRLFVTTDTIAR